MADDVDLDLLRLVRTWRRRFGDPPPNLSEAALIRRAPELP